jgi:hypothetical protein
VHEAGKPAPRRAKKETTAAASGQPSRQAPNKPPYRLYFIFHSFYFPSAAGQSVLQKGTFPQEEKAAIASALKCLHNYFEIWPKNTLYPTLLTHLASAALFSSSFTRKRDQAVQARHKEKGQKRRRLVKGQLNTQDQMQVKKNFSIYHPRSKRAGLLSNRSSPAPKTLAVSNNEP